MKEKSRSDEKYNEQDVAFSLNFSLVLARRRQSCPTVDDVQRLNTHFSIKFTSWTKV